MKRKWQNVNEIKDTKFNIMQFSSIFSFRIFLKEVSAISKKEQKYIENVERLTSKSELSPI